MPRRRHLILAAVMLATCAGATAVLAADEIGIFFDPDADSSSGATTEPNELLTAYLVILDPAAAEPISGWECRLSWHTEGPDLIPVQWNLRGGATNFDDAPSFRVGVDTPLPIAEHVVLMDFQVLVPTVDDPSVLFVQAHPLPSLIFPPNSDYFLRRPIYASGSQGELHPLTQNSGCESRPVAEINGPAPEPITVLAGPALAVMPFDDVNYTQLPLRNEGDTPISATIDLTGGADVLLRIGDGGWMAAPLWVQLEPGADSSVGILVLDDGALPLTCTVASCEVLLETEVRRDQPGFTTDPVEVDLGIVDLDTPVHEPVTVINQSMHPLSLTIEEECSHWMAEPSIMTVLPFAEADFMLSFEASLDGTYPCEINLFWNNTPHELVLPCTVFAGDPLAAPDAGLPDRPRLVAGYPNPFNPRTTVAFALPSAQRASLRIYDLRGRLVRDLVDGVFAAGRHEVIWEGTTDTGSAAPSGAYLCRLEAGGAQDVLRLVLAR